MENERTHARTRTGTIYYYMQIKYKILNKLIRLFKSDRIFYFENSMD